MMQELSLAGFKNIEVIGCNALPDKLVKKLDLKTLTNLMRLSKVIPARFHYHAIAIGRKP
jgi:hypothetical protein